MLESMIAPIGRRYQTKETLDEIRSVFLAELDYRIEAENGGMFQRIHEEDAAIVIPKVHHALSSRRVLTTDLIGGVDYQTFCRDAPAEDRDLAAQTVWRFMFRALFRHGVLYADPHPGNYRFLGGGRVAFLDFGCVKVLPESLVTKRYIVAAQREDWAEFERAVEEELGFDPTARGLRALLVLHQARDETVHRGSDARVRATRRARPSPTSCSAAQAARDEGRRSAPQPAQADPHARRPIQ